MVCYGLFVFVCCFSGVIIEFLGEDQGWAIEQPLVYRLENEIGGSRKDREPL